MSIGSAIGFGREETSLSNHPRVIFWIKTLVSWVSKVSIDFFHFKDQPFELGP